VLSGIKYVKETRCRSITFKRVTVINLVLNCGFSLFS